MKWITFVRREYLPAILHSRDNSLRKAASFSIKCGAGKMHRSIGIGSYLPWRRRRVHFLSFFLLSFCSVTAFYEMYLKNKIHWINLINKRLNYFLIYQPSTLFFKFCFGHEFCILFFYIKLKRENKLLVTTFLDGANSRAFLV